MWQQSPFGNSTLQSTLVERCRPPPPPRVSALVLSFSKMFWKVDSRLLVITCLYTPGKSMARLFERPKYTEI